MTNESQTTFQVTSWDEKPANEFPDGSKVTQASVTQSYTGAIMGESRVEYVMFHRADKTAAFVGIEHISGTVQGRSGSIVIQHSGTYDGGIARSDWTVVPGSGTGELIGMEGNGFYSADHSGQGKVSFTPSFP